MIFSAISLNSFLLFFNLMTKTEKILKYLVYVGLVILLSIPFIISNDLFQSYVTGKAFTFRVVVEILVVIWLILAILYPKYRPKKNWVLISFVLFTISLFVSNFFGVDQTASFWSGLERMEGWVTIIHLLGLFIVMGSVLNTKKEWYNFFKVSVVASFIMFILALKQVIDYGNSAEDLKIWGIFRIYTTIGNPALFAVYALFNAYLSLLLIFRYKPQLLEFAKFTKKTCLYNWQIWFYILTFVLNTWMVYQSVTRGTMLGFVGGLILIFLLLAFLEKGKTIYKKILIGFIVATILFTGTVFSLKESDFIKNNQSLNRFATMFEIKGSSQTRVNNWIVAYDGFQQKPILGWGQGNFDYVYSKYYLPRQQGIDDNLWFDRVHNVIFDWLIGGLLGLLFYLSIWGSAILSIFKTSKLQNNEKAILISMLAGYFVHLLLLFDTLVSYLYFIFIIAFVYSITTKDQKGPQYQISEPIKKIIIVLILLITPFVVYLVNYQPYKAAGEILQATRVTTRNSNGEIVFYHQNPTIDNIKLFKSAIARDTFATADARREMLIAGNSVFALEINNQLKSQYSLYVYNEVNKQIEETPNDPSFPYRLTSFLAQIGQFERAEKYALLAIESAPKIQEMRIPLIRIYIMTDQKDKALAIARDTYELDESKKDLWVEYVRVADKFDDELLNQLIDQAIERGNEEWVKSLSEEGIEID